MPIPLMAAGAVASGLIKVVGGMIGSRKRRQEQRRAKADHKAKMATYSGLDTSNLALGQQNAFEDLTVNQRQAEFTAEQQNQGLANVLSANNQAAGSSGIAAMSQALANQQSLNMSNSAISIGQQEQQNQMRAAQEAARIQQSEIMGASQARGLEYEKSETLLGMSQQRLAGANAARDQAKAAIIGGLGDIAGGALQAGMGGVGMLNKQVAPVNEINPEGIVG